MCYNVTLTSLPTTGYWLIPKLCNDLMFSGHVSAQSIVLCFMLLSWLPRWFKGLWTLYYLFASFLSTATLDHYTSDVLIAMYITIPLVMHRRWVRSPTHPQAEREADRRRTRTQTHMHSSGPLRARLPL